jgi:hypothetical protein
MTTLLDHGGHTNPLCHRLLGRPASENGYVTGTWGPTDGATAAGGVSVVFALTVTSITAPVIVHSRTAERGSSSAGTPAERRRRLARTISATQASIGTRTEGSRGPQVRTCSVE